MPKPMIRLFGGFEITSAEAVSCRFETARSRDLIILLLLEPHRRFAREELAEMLWPEREPSTSRRALNTEVWRLRTSLSNAGIDSQGWFSCGTETICLQLPQDVEVDLHRFRHLMQHLNQYDQTNERITLRILRELERLYTGDLLSGIYQDWCLVWREMTRNEFLVAMDRLLEHLKRLGDWPGVLGCARRILAHDPLLEHIHREVIRCLVAMGDRPSAVKHYLDFKARLQAELDCAPMPETVSLYETTLGIGPVAPEDRGEPRQERALDQQIGQAICALRDTAKLLETLRSALRHSLPDQIP